MPVALEQPALWTEPGEPRTRWVQAETYELPSYLRSFLRALGCDLPVFAAMDGQPLVSYQAAMRREDWRRAWRALEGPFKAQQAYYRHVQGGKAAPKLDPRAEARFASAGEARRSESMEVHEVPRWSVQRTFVRVTWPQEASEAPSRPRCDSDGRLDGPG